MNWPVIYLYTEDANTEVVACPHFIEVISRDDDAFRENKEHDAEPLDKTAVARLRERNREFEENFFALLKACRELTYPHIGQHIAARHKIEELLLKFACF